MEQQLPKIKSPQERDNLDLLELVCQLHSRALSYPSEQMHNTYWEARNELASRLEQNTALTDLLEDLKEYFDRRSDIDNEGGANQEMLFLERIEKIKL